MILRLWLLVVLTLAGAFAPSRACARTAETRTWDFFAATVETRQETAPQVADSHLGFAACGYELASGYSQAAESTTAAASDGLAASVSASFRGGNYSEWVAETDTIVFRGENFGQGSGRFFGAIKPVNSLDAEIMYNISKWGNNATQLGEYVIPAGTRGFIGGVEGGTGMQIFLEDTSGVQLLDSSTLFTSELKFITH